MLFSLFVTYISVYHFRSVARRDDEVGIDETIVLASWRETDDEEEGNVGRSIIGMVAVEALFIDVNEDVEDI